MPAKNKKVVQAEPEENSESEEEAEAEGAAEEEGSGSEDGEGEQEEGEGEEEGSDEEAPVVGKKRKAASQGEGGAAKIASTETSFTAFVGNLSFQTTGDSLQEAFASCGKVNSARVIYDKFEPTRSKGFGYVDFGDAASLKKGLETMNGADVDGRNIRVDAANSKGSDGGGGRGGRGGDRGGRGGGFRGGRGGDRGGRGGFGGRGGRGGDRGGFRGRGRGGDRGGRGGGFRGGRGGDRGGFRGGRKSFD